MTSQDRGEPWKAVGRHPDRLVWRASKRLLLLARWRVGAGSPHRPAAPWRFVRRTTSEEVHKKQLRSPHRALVVITSWRDIIMSWRISITTEESSQCRRSDLCTSALPAVVLFNSLVVSCPRAVSSQPARDAWPASGSAHNLKRQVACDNGYPPSPFHARVLPPKVNWHHHHSKWHVFRVRPICCRGIGVAN